MSPFAWADASEDEGAFLNGVYQGVSTAGILGEYAESVKFLDDGSRVILVELDESSDEESAPAQRIKRRWRPAPNGMQAIGEKEGGGSIDLLQKTFTMLSTHVRPTAD